MACSTNRVWISRSFLSGIKLEIDICKYGGLRGDKLERGVGLPPLHLAVIMVAEYLPNIKLYGRKFEFYQDTSEPLV